MMPTLESSYESDGHEMAYCARLMSIALKESVLIDEDVGEITRVEITYTLSTDEEDFEHIFNFYTNDFSEDNTANWGDFFDRLLNTEEIQESLLYHIKRNGKVMREFVALCFTSNNGSKPPAA